MTLSRPVAALAFLAAFTALVEFPRTLRGAPPVTPAPSVSFACPMHPWIHSPHPGKCTICGMDLVRITDAGDNAAAAPGLVRLTPAAIATVGVETTPIVRQTLVRTVRVNGTIDDDDSRHRLLTARTEGRIEKLHVTLVGAVVNAGEPLYDLYSPELQTAQREFVQLVRAGDLAAGALPAVRARLEQMGMTARQLEELVTTGEPKLITTIFAPEAGTVVEKSVYQGQWVKTGDTLFAVADFSRMWFLFDAYEQDLPWLQVGQRVEITTRAVPGEVLEAPIDFIDPNFNESTHTTRVRVTLANPHINAAGAGHLLFHRVLAEARVFIETPAVLTAPRSALLDRGAGPVVYVQENAGEFRPRPVRVGRRGDALVEILDGLNEGERVVTTGALLVDAQAQLALEGSPDAAHDGSRAAPAKSNIPDDREAAVPSVSADDPARSLAIAAVEAADALANDDFARYRELSGRLSALGAKFPQLPRLQIGEDLKAARRSFEPWSTAVADLLRPRRSELGLKIFECPMTPRGRGRWLQHHQPLKNPFFGSAMPDCGVELP
jgi:Cu(I)/Ag(I) efflux system membrane fusion protein